MHSPASKCCDGRAVATTRGEHGPLDTRSRGKSRAGHRWLAGHRPGDRADPGPPWCVGRRARPDRGLRRRDCRVDPGCRGHRDRNVRCRSIRSRRARMPSLTPIDDVRAPRSSRDGGGHPALRRRGRDLDRDVGRGVRRECARGVPRCARGAAAHPAAARHRDDHLVGAGDGDPEQRRRVHREQGRAERAVPGDGGG